MKEIEVKAILHDTNVVVEKLTDLGCVFSKPVSQEDRVFFEPAETVSAYIKQTKDVAVLRIRIIDGGEKTIFTVKKRGHNRLVAIEHETYIESAEEMERALELMNYTRQILIQKKRMTARYKEYEICIDEVEELGSFIEVERLVKEGDEEAIQQELFDFLKTLGIVEKDRVFVGYDILMLQHEQLPEN